MLEVLDVTYRIINWKYQSKASTNDIYNKTITYAIDIYLILLEEAIQLLDINFLNIHTVELIKRINNSEINFIPKLKLTYVMVKNFD